jgi:hypothetical protein
MSSMISSIALIGAQCAHCFAATWMKSMKILLGWNAQCAYKIATQAHCVAATWMNSMISTIAMIGAQGGLCFFAD